MVTSLGAPRFSMGLRPLDRPFYRQLLALALPIALQNMLSFGVNMLDGIMVGTLGDTAISSVQLANQVSVFLMMFIRGVSAGSAVLIAQYWGKQDMPRIQTVFGIGLKLSLAVAVVFAALVSVMPDLFMRVFNSEAAIVASGSEYLVIVCWSYVFYAASSTFIAMLRNIELVRFGLLVSAVSCIINLIANYVLIFGKYGFPALGVRGAAIATLLTRVVELLITLIYAFFKNERVKLTLRGLWANDSALWRDFLRYGAPILGGDIMWGLVGVGRSVIIGHLGQTAVAAYSIADVALQLATMFIFGLSGATCVIIGKSVGAKRYDLTRLYAKRFEVLFFVLGIVAAVFTYLIRPVIIGFYDVSPETKQLAMQYLIFGALTIWGTSYAASCFVGINRGSGDGNFVVKTDLICGWLIVLPLSALAGYVFHWPAYIVFFCLRIDQILKVFIAFFRLRGDRWIRNVTRE